MQSIRILFVQKGAVMRLVNASMKFLTFSSTQEFWKFQAELPYKKYSYKNMYVITYRRKSLCKGHFFLVLNQTETSQLDLFMIEITPSGKALV